MRCPGRGPGRPRGREPRGVLALGAAALLLTACTTTAATPEGTTASPASPAATSGPPVPPRDDADAVLSALTFLPLAAPDPVLGADDRLHLAYELLVMNPSGAGVALERVEALDAADGSVLGTMEGGALDAMIRVSGVEGPGFAAGSSGYVFTDVTLPPDATPPRALKHRITMRVTPIQGAASTSTITGVPVEVNASTAVLVEPPLKGDGWLVGSGCCAAITSHRGATLSIDGTAHAPERFAIDFVQLDQQGRLYSGDPAQNSSFPFFGAEVLSASPGTVVAAVDGLPDITPGTLPPDATVQTAGGNHVVVDMGEGRFAFYAHLQPGSMRVREGDRVETGQVLGLLGNSGNTDAPHLHFHVMDGPSPLQSNGLPFRFTRFKGQGRVTDPAPLAPPFPATAPAVPIDRSALAGPHTEQLPLDLQVIGFG